MKKLAGWLLVTLSFAVSIVFYIHLFTGSQSTFLIYLSSVLIFLLVANAFIVTRRKKMAAGAIIILLIALVILLGEEISISQVLSTYSTLIGNVVALILFVPLFSLPLSAGGYPDIMSRALKKGSTLWILLIFGFLTNLMSGLMLMGAVVLLYETTEKSLENLPRYMLTGLTSQVVTRGFAYASIWSPNFSSLALMLEVTGLRWLDVIPYNLFVLGGFIIINILFVKSTLNKASLNKDRQGGEIVYNKTKIVEFIVFLLIFIVLFATLEFVTDMSALNIVPLLSLGISFAWFLYLGKGREYHTQVYRMTSKISDLSGEILIFLSAGFLGSIFMLSSKQNILTGFISGFSERPFIIVLAFFFLIICFNLIGIHSLIVILTFRAAINSAACLISPHIIFVTIITAHSIGLMLSPFSIGVIITSTLNKLRPSHIGFGWNGMYSLAVTIWGLLVMYLLYLLVN